MIENEAKVKIRLDIEKAKEQLKDINKLTQDNTGRANIQKEIIKKDGIEIEKQNSDLKKIRDFMRKADQTTDNVMNKWRNIKGIAGSPSRMLDKGALGYGVNKVTQFAEAISDTYTAFDVIRKEAKKADNMPIEKTAEAIEALLKPALDAANKILSAKESIDATASQWYDYNQGLAGLGRSVSAKGSESLLESLWNSNYKMNYFKRNIGQAVKNNLAEGMTDFFLRKCGVSSGK